MPSTYTTNNGIELIGTGEQSGTWGDTTNTNLTLVDASLDGHTSITLASAGTSGSPNDVPITNGSTSNGRNRALIFTDGGDLGADVYVRLTPNDAKKIMFVRNSLSGSRNLILFQGTYNASNDFVLAAGKDAIVKFDGGGSGAVASAVLADFALDAATITTISNTTLNTATVNATTVDTTNIEVTNLKAKDGVSAGSIADSTGVVTLASSVLTTTDINGGSVDGVTLGTNSAVTEAQIDNININGNAITSTDTNGNIALTPDGTGEVDISKVDIDSGTIDGVTIGGSSAGVGTFTTANATTVDTTNIEVTNLKAKDGTSAGSIADSTGVVTLASSVLTTTDINGGTIDGTTIGGSTPAAVTGTTITGTGFVTTGDMTFGDNDKAIFGAGSDLSVYHDGSNSYIEEAGTGALKITSNGTGVDFESAGGETLAQFVTNGAVTLYHNNNQKLATTSTGIDVTGTVKSTVSSTGDFNFNAVSSGGGNYRIYPDDATTANPTWLHQSNSSEDQAWVIGGVERMRIDSSGNVGIATASPAEALDVTGTGLFSGRVGIGTDLGSNPSGADPDADNLVIDAGGANAGVTIDTGTAAKGSLFFADGATGDALKRGQLVYDHNGDYMAFATNAVERMRIDSSGNVGFGTTSPSENLHVVSTNGTALRLEATNTSTAGGIDFYGKDAGGTTYQAGNINAAGGTGSLEFSADPTDAEASTRVTFLTDGTERVRIDDTGLGIGTTSPAQALDVTGNAAVSGKAKVGTGADANGNGDELVLSKDQTNVGMSILAADATGICRILFGSQSAVNVAKIQHTESSGRLTIQAEDDIYFQTGGTNTRMTLNTSGDLDVTGALSKGSGSFKIDHPLKPDTHHLVHSFLEGPQADNIYRGTVALVGGAATVNLDTAGRMTEGTFVALNGNVQCLTSNEQGWTAVKGSVSGNTLTIQAQDSACTDTVSWMVIGERKDQHMIDTHWTDAAGRVITEPEKPPVEEDETV